MKSSFFPICVKRLIWNHNNLGLRIGWCKPYISVRNSSGFFNLSMKWVKRSLMTCLHIAVCIRITPSRRWLVPWGSLTKEWWRRAATLLRWFKTLHHWGGDGLTSGGLSERCNREQTLCLSHQHLDTSCQSTCHTGRALSTHQAPA